jgi:hypothetical protein
MMRALRVHILENNLKFNISDYIKNSYEKEGHKSYDNCSPLLIYIYYI